MTCEDGRSSQSQPKRQSEDNKSNDSTTREGDRERERERELFTFVDGGVVEGQNRRCDQGLPSSYLCPVTCSTAYGLCWHFVDVFRVANVCADRCRDAAAACDNCRNEACYVCYVCYVGQRSRRLRVWDLRVTSVDGLIAGDRESREASVN